MKYYNKEFQNTMEMILLFTLFIFIILKRTAKLEVKRKITDYLILS